MKSEIERKLKNNEDLNKRELFYIIENAENIDIFFTILAKFFIIEAKKSAIRKEKGVNDDKCI